MNIQKDVSLQAHSTMRLGGTADYACEVTSRQELLAAITWAQEQSLPMRVIGTGSNIVWRDEGFQGLLVINRITQFEIYNEDAENSYVTIGAGEDWDSAVARCVQAGLSGIEAMSLIPGTTGATPIQNVGAYGQDISQTLTTIQVYDTQAHEFVMLASADCGFGYRTSRFKTTDRERFYIVSITLHLTRTAPQPPFYPAVAAYFEAHNITQYTPAAIREAVIAIRTAKLPDPLYVANNGSFFANPVIARNQFTQLQADFNDVSHWPAGENVKVSAAWLIEQAGFKDFHDPETGMGTWPSQPLVLVNEQAKTTADLLTFKQKIVTAVQEKFGITLEQEPELLP